MQGYSNTPLAKKLGIKTGTIMRLVNTPDYYFSLFTDMPERVIVCEDTSIKKDFIHFFTKKEEELNSILPQLKSELLPNGVIWVSWPKKRPKALGEITENNIRDFALKIGLVDIKVCAVDEIWSGLKLVIPLKER